MKVSIGYKRGRGKIEIEYYSDEELERIGASSGHKETERSWKEDTRERPQAAPIALVFHVEHFYTTRLERRVTRGQPRVSLAQRTAATNDLVITSAILTTKLNLVFCRTTCSINPLTLTTPII